MQHRLVLPDRREHGAFPVLDDRGTALGSIAVAWFRSTFTATDAAGRPWCAGAADWGGLSGTWRVTGPGGDPLLVVRNRALRARAEVELARGGTLTVSGSVWRRDFAVTDAAGTTVLRAVPRTGVLSLRPFDYAVEHSDAVTTPEVVGLVQVWRTARKQDAAAAGGSAAAAGAASS